MSSPRLTRTTLVLTDLRDENGTVRRAVELSQDGELVIVGLDQGSPGDGPHGFPDYEFERRLSRGETAKMRQLLGITRDEDLLAVLAGRFTSTELLEAFIHGHGISGRFWSRLGD